MGGNWKTVGGHFQALGAFSSFLAESDFLSFPFLFQRRKSFPMNARISLIVLPLLLQPRIVAAKILEVHEPYLFLGRVCIAQFSALRAINRNPIKYGYFRPDGWSADWNY